MLGVPCVSPLILGDVKGTEFEEIFKAVDGVLHVLLDDERALLLLIRTADMHVPTEGAEGLVGAIVSRRSVVGQAAADQFAQGAKVEPRDFIWSIDALEKPGGHFTHGTTKKQVLQKLRRSPS